MARVSCLSRWDSYLRSLSVALSAGKLKLRASASVCKIIYFKLYKTQIRVIEQAMETAALMLGTDKSGATVWR